jgi:transcriptional regulator with XRE-family HTH domain
MENLSQSLTSESNEWDRIRLEFIAEHEAGNRPTLDAFAARYPQYAGELTDFILDYLQTENAVARQEAREAQQGTVRETPAPYAIRAWEKTLAALGIPTEGVLTEPTPATTPTTPEVITFSAPATLNDLRKARNWSPRNLAEKLQMPVGVVLKLQSGQISAWPQRLSERLAEVLTIAVSEAEAVLRATRTAQHPVAAAFSAQGQPDTATVVQKQGESMTFDQAMAEETLTDAQKKVWQME